MNKKILTAWVGILDPAKLVALVDRRGWSIALFSCLFGMCVASQLPIAKEFFQLTFVGALLCMFPVAVFAVAISSASFRKRLTPVQMAFMLLMTSATFQFYLWSLVCFSVFPGAAMMAAFPILLASYHGQFFQISRKYPFGAIAILLGVMAALLIAPSQHHVVIILLGGIMGLASAIIMGDNERRSVEIVKERDSLKAAVDAHILFEQAEEIAGNLGVISEIRGTNHDANNALSGILFNLQYLVSKSRHVNGEKANVALIKELAEDLSISIERLRSLLEKGRDIGKEHQESECVDISSVISDAIKLTNDKFSHVLIECNDELKKRDCSTIFSIFGGEQVLRRIITNLLFNACEGDGVSSADSVLITIRANEYADVELLVDDNGPGFSAQQLADQRLHLLSTKAGGSGLGLHTTKRLVHANRGSITLAKSSMGGASVSLVLPHVELSVAESTCESAYEF